jgi:hypothetical protein
MPAINGFGNNFNSRKGIPSSNRGPSNTNTSTQRGKIEDLKRQLSGGQLENCQCPEDEGRVGKPDNKITTMMTGEEDGGGKIGKPRNPAEKPDNKITTMMTGEEDGSGKIGKPRNPGEKPEFIAEKPDLKLTTLAMGEEDNQKNLYSTIRSNFPPNKNHFNMPFNSDLS